MAERLRIAIAGTGFGERYVIGLQGNPGVEVVAVYSRRLERAAALAEKYDIPQYTRNFEELLKIPYLDAIAIVTPNSTHAEFVGEVIRARKHVICDKPLSLNAAEAVDLYHQAESARIRHITFVPYRFSPASIAIKKAADGSHAGRRISVKAIWGVDMRNDPLRWRFQRKLSGAGVVADLGAHVFDLLMWWCGPIKRVLGRCRTLVPERPHEAGGRVRPVDVPDEAWSLVEFAGPGIGSVRLSWNERHSQSVEIEGDRGSILYHSPSMLQWLEGKGEFTPQAKLLLTPGPEQATELASTTREFERPETALAHIFRDVVNYLKTGDRSPCIATFEEGARVMQVVDAVERSDIEGRWVELPGEV